MENTRKLGSELPQILMDLVRANDDYELMLDIVIRDNRLMEYAEKGLELIQAQQEQKSFNWFKDFRKMAGATTFKELAILAVLSADSTLESNIAMFRSWKSNNFEKGTVRFPYQRKTIQTLLNCENDNEELCANIVQKESLKGKGRLAKTQRFFLNLCGDYSVATVDIWILAAFQNLPVELHQRVFQHSGIYQEFAEAVEAAARDYNEEPATFQTLVWIGIRGEIF